jgi:hypothetical protein
LLEAAQREFEDETGLKPTRPFTTMTPANQTSGSCLGANSADCCTLRPKTVRKSGKSAVTKISQLALVDATAVSKEMSQATAV